MRQFEVPFNHKNDLLQFYIKYKKELQKHIIHIYTAPFIEDYCATRHLTANKPSERSVYELQIRQLQQAGYEVALTLNGNDLINNDFIKYYVDNLNIKTYICKHYKDALLLKQYNPSIKVIASITKKLNFDDISKKDLSIYDYIVLYYNFNASIDLIRKLPTRNKYILMTNTWCDYTCNFAHWYNETNFKCPLSINGYKNTTWIFAEDLKYFDPYINIYKLQGRDYETSIIIKELLYFLYNKDIDDHFESFKLRCNYDSNYYNRYIQE